MAHPGGRPTEYRPEYCDVVIKQMSRGAAIEELPLYLGVCKDTIYEWKKKHEEFADALKKGKSFSEAIWMRKGRVNLKNSKFNYTGWYMNMKNRFGWRDSPEQTTPETKSETAEKIAEAKDAYQKPY